jgi:hypothetical protein
VSKPRYLLSLPERIVRSLAALSGGLLQETANVILPAGVRRSTSYRTMVEVALRFLVQEVGEVEGIYATGDRLAEHFLLKRTASHGLELLGILAFHASPIWVLAALADASGGGRHLISEISQALQDEGLLQPGSHFETMEQVLNGLEATSKHLATTLNLPPIDVVGLQREWLQLKGELGSIPPRNLPAVDRIEQLWSDIRASARHQEKSVFTVSSLLAISAIAHVPGKLLWLSRAAHSAARSTGRVLGDGLLAHYTQALAEIGRTGFLAYWAREFKPYLRGAAEQFAPAHATLTDRLFSRRAKR